MRNAEEFTCIEPAYVAGFSCDSNKCGGARCCRGWQQILDEEALFRYRALEGEAGKEVRSGLVYLEEARGFGFRHEEDRCIFLRPDGLCDLQQKYGEGMLTDVCAEYPRKTRIFPHHVVERALCVTCSIAAGLLLDNPKPLQLVQRKISSTRKAYFQPAGDADVLDQLEFFDWQIKGIELLQNRGLSLQARLQKLLQALAEADENMPWGRDVAEAVWQSWSLTQKYAFFRDFVTGIEDDTVETAWYLERGERLSQHMTEQAAAEMLQQEILEPYGYMLENYLVNEWFKELYPCAVLGTFAYNGLYFVVQWEVWQFLLLLELEARRENRAQQKSVPQLIHGTVQWLASRLNHYTAAREVLSELLRA